MPGLVEEMLKARAVKSQVLVPLIDSWLMDRPDDWQLIHPKVLKLYETQNQGWNSTGRFSASASGGCLRKGVLRYTGTPAPERKLQTPRSGRIADDGHYRHLRFHSYLLHMSDDRRVPLRSIKFESSTGITKWNVRGSLDHRIQIRIAGSWIDYIVDFKGANQWQSQKIASDGANAGNTSQLVIYCWSEKVDLGILLYEDKNTQELHEFTIQITSERIAQERNKLRTMNKHVRDGTLPPRPPECFKGKFRGYACEFARLCYPELQEG